MAQERNVVFVLAKATLKKIAASNGARRNERKLAVPTPSGPVDPARKRKAINDEAHPIVDLGPLGVNDRHAGKVNVEVPDHLTMIDEAHHAPDRHRVVVRRRVAGVKALGQKLVVNDHAVDVRKAQDRVTEMRRNQTNAGPVAQAEVVMAHEAAAHRDTMEKDTASQDVAQMVAGNQVNDSAGETVRAAEPVRRRDDPVPGTVVAREAKDLRQARVQTVLALAHSDRDREAEASAFEIATDIRF